MGIYSDGQRLLPLAFLKWTEVRWTLEDRSIVLFRCLRIESCGIGIVTLYSHRNIPMNVEKDVKRLD